MSLKTSAKQKLAKVFSNIKFLVALAVACAIFVHFTVLKGFEPLFNFYTDFAIQPKMFQYWAEKSMSSMPMVQPRCSDLFIHFYTL